MALDWYGRRVPRYAHGNMAMMPPTSSSKAITDAVVSLYDANVDPKLLVRRLTVVVGGLVDSRSVKPVEEQLNLFADHEAEERRKAEQQVVREREKRMQKAALTIQKRFGKNAILRGTDFEEGATLRDRNAQVGGHKG